jgi:hypothetical protein
MIPTVNFDKSEIRVFYDYDPNFGSVHLLGLLETRNPFQFIE